MHLYECYMSQPINNTGYYNFWGPTTPAGLQTSEFTDFEIALMEGGNSLEKPKIEKFPFIKEISKNTP